MVYKDGKVDEDRSVEWLLSLSYEQALAEMAYYGAMLSITSPHSHRRPAWEAIVDLIRNQLVENKWGNVPHNAISRATATAMVSWATRAIPGRNQFELGTYVRSVVLEYRKYRTGVETWL